jgi:cation diffusion facilitator family transporter
MPNDSMRTVLVALGSGLAVAVAKAVVAVVTGSSAMAAEASHSLADTANDLFLFVAQRRSTRRPDDRHPLGYGREAYFWALIAALGVFIAGAAFSLREGITELIHPSVTSSFTVAYVVLAISTVFDLVSFRQSAGQMIGRPGPQSAHRVVDTQGIAAVLIGLVLIRTSLRLGKRSHDFLVGAWLLPPAPSPSVMGRRRRQESQDPAATS